PPKPWRRLTHPTSHFIHRSSTLRSLGAGGERRWTHSHYQPKLQRRLTHPHSTPHPHYLTHLSITHFNHPVAVGSKVVIVGHGNDGLAKRTGEGLEDLEHILG